MIGNPAYFGRGILANLSQSAFSAALEKDILLKSSVEFNPPVHFLQTAGHKEAMSIELDNVNLNI